MGPFFKGHRSKITVSIILLGLLFLTIPPIESNEGINNNNNNLTKSLRIKRQVQGTDTQLTVEWEGIQSGDYPESSVRGFLVEFRAEDETQWNVHKGIIPYEGPNHQYRVKIPYLLAGVTYLVRIKVLGKDNEILIESAEIRARNEVVSIRCDSDKVTAPRNIRLEDITQYSIAVSWDAPECGSIGEYYIEANGVGENEFDVHRQTVTQPSASIANLLPGSEYIIRVKAIDRNRVEGPWSEDSFARETRGKPPQKFDGITILYISSDNVRISWHHHDDDRLQHYEVIITELFDDDLKKIERLRLPSNQLTYLFTNLKPASSYHIAVIPYVNHEPVKIYSTKVDTLSQDTVILSKRREDKPTISVHGNQHIRVNWRKPTFLNGNLDYFLVEYRKANDSKWQAIDHIIKVNNEENEYEIISPDLLDSFSIRIMSIGKDKQLLGRSVETTVSGVKKDDTSCIGINGIPLDLNYESDGSSSVTFMWTPPKCDGVDNLLEGYEYAFWNLEEDEVPEQPTYSRHNHASFHNLNPKATYGFRVRSRFLNDHSPWSNIQEIVPALSDEEHQLDASENNIYNLRLILDPPRNYLVWTPLPEHRNIIKNVKLSYKGTEDDEWKKIVSKPSQLICPSNIKASVDDFCHNLNNLDFGKQYTSDVIYELENGTWTSHASPLYFVLVEAPEESSQPSKPNSVVISQKDSNQIEVRWLPPLSNTTINKYEISVVDRHTNVAHKEVVPGSAFIHSIDIPQHGSGLYDISITAITDSGIKSIPATENIQLRRDFTHQASPQNVPEIPKANVPHYCQKPTVKPDRVQLIKLNSETISLRWIAPSDYPDCLPQFLISGTLDGEPYQETIQANTRELRMPLSKASEWLLTVSSVNALGQGPRSEPARYISENVPIQPKIAHRSTRTICDPRTDYWCRSNKNQFENLGPIGQRGELISQPIITPKGNDLLIQWQSKGNGRNIYGYRVQFQTSGSGWTPYGQLVPYVGDDQKYQQVLSGLQLGNKYNVHVQALDRNSYILYTSPEVSGQISCSLPTEPPQHVNLDAVDARHVKLSFQPPSYSSWGCNSIDYEIAVDQPHGIRPIKISGKQTSYVFDSEANQQWVVRIRTVNSAGQSAWSNTVTIKTPSFGELIEGPFLSQGHGFPRLSWKASEGSEGLVKYYEVEYRDLNNPNAQWNTLDRPINYYGTQRPYTADLHSLPPQHPHVVRVKAFNDRRQPVYTSGTVSVQNQKICHPPRRPPTDFKVNAVGPTQIRVSWIPLPQNEWGCDTLWYVIKYNSPNSQGFKNITRGENQVIFDSEPFARWTFEIQSANPAGASQWSRVENVQTLDTAPGPVTNLIISPLSSNAIQVTWRPPQNPNGIITSYEITYQLISRGMCDQTPERPITIKSIQPSYTISGLHPHSKYRIGVAAVTTSAGERVTQDITTDSYTPSAPPAHITITKTTDNGVEFTWQAPPCLQTNGDISEYEYEISPIDPRSTERRITDTTKGNRAQINLLQPASHYRLKVRAYTSKGAGPWSNEVRFTTTGTTTVGQPEVVGLVSSGMNEAQVIWQNPDDNRHDKFRCRYSPQNSNRYEQKEFPARSPCEEALIRSQQLPTPPPRTRYGCGRIDNVKPDLQYNVQLQGHIRDGDWQPWTQPKPQIITPPRLGPVTITSLNKISSTTTSLTFSWSVGQMDLTRCTSFRITVVPSDGRSHPQTYTVDKDTKQYTASGLKPNTLYKVTVEAVTVGVPSTSKSIDMQTDAEKMLELPYRPMVIEEKPTTITIKWDVDFSDKCSNFVIEYRLDNSAWQEHPRRVPCIIGRRTYTSAIESLPTNSPIDFRVKVVDQQARISNPSPEVRGRTKCSPPEIAPQGVRVDAPTMNDVRVSWSRPAKSTWNCDQLSIEIGYVIEDMPEKIVPVPGDKTDYTFPSEPNTRWTIRVRLSNQMGPGPWSGPQSITTRQGAPGAVRDLQAKPISPNEVRIMWKSPTIQRGTIVGYDISYRLKYRLACPEEEPRDVSRDFVTIYNHKDLTYTLTGLLPYSLYEVKVRARTTELGPEETKEVSTDAQPPSAPPLDLQYTYTLPRSVSFQWEPVDCSQRHGNIINYEYEILGQDDWAKLERQIANTSDTRITIEGLTPYTKYVMRVKAYNNIGGGPNTENLDVMTAKADAPLPPQDLVVTHEGTDYFIISWLPPYPPYGPHDSYKIRHKLLDSNDWREIELDVHNPKLKCPAHTARFCYNVTGLDNGLQYKAQVSARIEGGIYGPWSSAVIANTLQVLPDAPRAIELIEKTDHSLHIKWVPPIDPHGHITQYRLNIVSLDNINSVPQTYHVDHPTLDYIFENLNPETFYNVSLSAGTKRGFGPEIWTRYQTAPFKIPIVLEAPVVTTEGPHSLNVHWKAVSDPKNKIHGYIIEFRTLDNSVWNEYGDIVRHDSVKRNYFKKLVGLEADTLYLIRIKVVDKKQRTSQPSPEAQGRTGCDSPLAAPINVQASAPSNVQVKVSWQSPPKESFRCGDIKYRIEYYTGKGKKQEIELPSSVVDKFFDSQPNTEWRFRLRSENDAGHSDWSNELRIKTPEGAPSSITGLRAKSLGPDSVQVSWKKPDNPNGDITGYTVTYQLKSLGECGDQNSKPITINTDDPNVVLKDLLPDATYEIKVTAHTSLPGEESKPVLVTTDESPPTAAPDDLHTVSVTATRADVIWNEIDCEERNGKITDYEYELVSVDAWGKNKTDHVSTRKVFFDDLAPYNTYKIRVKAKNSKGSGPFSEWLEFTTLPSAPSSPGDLREEQSFPNAVEISFLPPSPPNGIVDEYKVRYTPSNKYNFKEIRVSLDDLVCSDSSKKDRLCYRLSGLEPEEDYDIQVQAHVEGGDWGDWSEVLQTKTEQQNIPVLENGLEIDFTKPTSIGVKWYGVDSDQAEHVVGYVVEYKSEDDDEWQEYGNVIRHRSRDNNYKLAVKELTEATEYFFRLRVVGKNDKRGSPGPETHAKTNCGRPEEPPSDLKITSEDFNTIVISWKNPDKETWKCDEVEFILEYVNTTNRGSVNIPMDSESEITFDSQPGTRWDIKMKTQTVEEGVKPQYSRWSEKSTIVTQSLPGEIFVNVEPKSPTTAEVVWELPEKDQTWKYGVDISYKLVKLGGCDVTSKTSTEKPIKLENVQNKKILLENLKPGSEYEIIVTPRKPGHLSSNVKPPQTIRRFKTEVSTPSKPPTNLRVESRGENELGYKWDPPECADQNGEITQYEYEITGRDDWNQGVREGVSPRTKTVVGELQSGSLYSFRVRAFTSEGPGPWSEPIEARTTGSELGPPRELTAVLTKSTSIQLTWLPPYPEKSQVVAYKVKYSPRAEDSNPIEVEISGDQLSCDGFTSPLLTKDNICSTINGLKPSTTYKFAVAAKGQSGNWGPWSTDYFSTTRKDDSDFLGGALQLISAGHDNLRVKWVPPSVIGDNINKYELFISVASALDQSPKKNSVGGNQREFHFKGLKSVTVYNVTVQGLSDDKKLWFISGTFPTTDIGQGLLTWLGPPTDLTLIEKSDDMLHVTWNPPEIFDPVLKDLLTHYRITISPLDPDNFQSGSPKNYTVPVPGNSIKFTDLNPETIYNITVQAGTNSGYGEILWGTYSTLSIGKSHILRLKDRTPTTLTVEWDPVWGTSHKGYVIAAKSLASVFPYVRLNTIKSFEVDSSLTSFVLYGLDPSTTYNVTLMLRDQNDGAWGAYSTLPPGWFVPRNLKHCDKTNYAMSLNWEPVELNKATHYQVRYLRLNQHDIVWTEESERKSQDLLCPKDGCGKLCYLVFNLNHAPSEYVFQVRAKVNGEWNRWKTAGRPTTQEAERHKTGCCIVPPPYYVENIGQEGTYFEIDINPAATEKNVTRYYVVVDERNPAGDTNWTQLTDKVTANKQRLPYYVAASFDTNTLTEPTKVKIGDGTVIGGYLNYPLVKGKIYNYEIYTKWMIDDNPVIARLRATPYISAGWPWWWLLLLLLLLLLAILLTCCLFWCIQGRYRSKRARSMYTNGQAVPLLTEEKRDIHGLESGAYTKEKGDFEEGYARGFRDAKSLGSADNARRHMHETFSGQNDRFHEGYVKGLRDAGLSGMSTSMHNLAQKRPADGSYSPGYMQGFRDGNSGIFGDHITDSLLRRLEESYPKDDEFRKGYLDGFKDAVNARLGSRTLQDSRQLQKSLTELTERLVSLEKTKGDEIHSTKIYHVYNQRDGGYGYSSSGAQLAQELDEIQSQSRRSTLRRHYTPGDYLRYASDAEAGYSSLSHPKRSLSASALGRESHQETSRSRHLSGTSYLSRASASERQTTDKFTRPYKYRSRSDIGSPRRYASQTLLSGARPGPSTPHSKLDALHTLQKELDTLSRSPGGGYTSDTGYFKSKGTGQGYSNYDYETMAKSFLPTSPSTDFGKIEADRLREEQENALREYEKSLRDLSHRVTKAEMEKLNAERQIKNEAERAKQAERERQNAERRAREEAERARLAEEARLEAERKAKQEAERARLAAMESSANKECLEQKLEREKKMSQAEKDRLAKALQDEADRARQAELDKERMARALQEEADRARKAEEDRLNAERMAQDGGARARQAELERERLARALQDEADRVRQAELEKERMAKALKDELERAKRDNELSREDFKLKIERERKDAELEKQRLAKALQDEADRARQAELEKQRLAKAVQDEAERARKAEQDRLNAEKLIKDGGDKARQAELEKQRLAKALQDEADRARQAEREKERLARALQDEADRARRAEQEKLNAERMSKHGDDKARQAELEKERLAKALQDEADRARQAELEKQRLAKALQDEADRARRAEQERLNAEKLIKDGGEKARQAEREKERLEKALQDEAERARQAQREKDRLARALQDEADRARKAEQEKLNAERMSKHGDDKARQAELEKERLAKALQDEADRARQAEREKERLARALQDEADRARKAEQDKLNAERLIKDGGEKARQAEREKERLEKALQDEAERARQAQREKERLAKALQDEADRARKAEQDRLNAERMSKHGDDKARQAELEKERLAKALQDEAERARQAEREKERLARALQDEADRARRAEQDRLNAEKLAREGEERAYQAEIEKEKLARALEEEAQKAKLAQDERMVVQNLMKDDDEKASRLSRIELENDMLTAKVHETANALNELVKTVNDNTLSSTQTDLFSPLQMSTSVAQAISKKEGTEAVSQHVHRYAAQVVPNKDWPNDLIDIVNEPMNHTLDRMKHFSTSLSNIEGNKSQSSQQLQQDDGATEHEEVRYQRTYREDYATGSMQR
uniref:Fibronectin type-III domain-containing protein n=1 Tax=Strongyloides stercoralis TaxID=6248 RepID=A0A913IDA2_STRER